MLSRDLIKGLAKYAKDHWDALSNNEASTKQSLVLPLIQALGYNVFDKMEVDPEFTADIGVKKGEKVDYAIMRDGEPIILVECKAINITLNNDVLQLYRYFTPTKARFGALSFGVLTNGVVYRFFSDLKTPNAMDQTHFWEVDIRTADEDAIAHLRQFAKDNFDAANIKEAARETNILAGVKANIQRMYDNPDDEFSKTLFRNVGVGDLAIDFAANHRELVKRAFHEFVSERSGAGNSGGFSQEMSSGESQSTAEQAAVISLSPLPTAQQGSLTTSSPADGWQPLSDFQPEHNDVKPTQMMFPDNSSVAINKWNEVVVEVVRWLTSNGYLDARHCPVQRTPKRYLVATRPIHPGDKKFINEREVNSLYVEVSYTAPDTIKNTKFIIERAGMDVSQFLVKRDFHEFARDHSRNESSGEFQQQISAGGSQIAPSGEWRPLSETTPPKQTKLRGILFPDNSSVATRDWNQLIVEVVQWLNDNNHLNAPDLPIKLPRASSRYIVAERPIRPSGEPYPKATRVKSFWVDTHQSAAQMVTNTRFVIERVGMDASEFKVRW